MSDADTTSDPSGVVVTAGSQRVALVDGGTVAFGRSHVNDVVIGQLANSVEDEQVSRVAGVITWADGAVRVTNRSSYSQITVWPKASRATTALSPNDELRLQPGTTVITVPGKVARYDITVEFDTTAVVADCPEPLPGPVTPPPLQLSEKHRLDLAALCYGLLKNKPGHPAARVSSYKEAAAKRTEPVYRKRGDGPLFAPLGESAMRARIGEIAEQMREYGVPGLVDGDNYRDVIAAYAVRNHLVTLTDIERLDELNQERNPGSGES